MATKQALETRPEASETPIFLEAEKFLDQMKDFSQAIARRAYEFFEGRGREWGHELEDWFRAESELMRRIPVEIKETETQLTVQAEVPGFTAEEIKISVEPRWLVISGKTEKKTEEKKEERVYTEFRSNQFCRELTLPAAVDPSKVTASLKDGILELAMTRAEPRKAVNIEVKTA